MLNTIVNYLQQKAASLAFVSYSYGLATKVKRKDGESNVAFPAVFISGQMNQVSFDTFPVMVFFMLDGEIKRETKDGEVSVAENQIIETYKLKAYLFCSVNDNSDCDSFTQKTAYSLAKTLTSDSSQLEDSLNFQLVNITATDFEFRKDIVWDELHDGIEYRLSDRQQLCSISLNVELEGVESCFVTDPCSDESFVYICPQKYDDMQVEQFETTANTNTYTRPHLDNRNVWMVIFDNIALRPSQWNKPFTSADFELTDTSFPVEDGQTVTIFYTRT